MPGMTVLEQEALKASTVTLLVQLQPPSHPSPHHQPGYGLLRKVGIPDFFATPLLGTPDPG
jgi:hypothetical protein